MPKWFPEQSPKPAETTLSQDEQTPMSQSRPLPALRQARLAASAPYLPPIKRALPAKYTECILAWCNELLPEEPVEVFEWAGADQRQPLHAIVIAFASGREVVIYRKAEELRQSHLIEALGVR